MLDTAIYSWDGTVLGHYLEPKDVYFWSSESGIPRPGSPSCEWNLGLDEKDVDDWECSHCDSLHPLTKYKCPNCGAVRVRNN